MLPSLAAWVGETLGIPLADVAVERPRALAGLNDVWILSVDGAPRFVLRSTPVGARDSAVSGIRIRKALALAGISVPRSIATTSTIAGYSLCELMTHVPGDDLAIAWEGMSHPQAMALAATAARTVALSTALFPDAGPREGWGRHAVGGTAMTFEGPWLVFLHEWLDWVAQRGEANETILPEQTQALARAFDANPGWPAVARETFIWDVAERNVMVKDGRWSGLVDQDSLMTGDRFVAPALARVALTKIGCPWADDYADCWMDAWQASAVARANERLYAGLYAMQIACKVGRELPDGRKEPPVPAGFLDHFLSRL